MQNARRFSSKLLYAVCALSIAGCAGPQLEMPQLEMPQIALPSFSMPTIPALRTATSDEKLIKEEPVAATTVVLPASHVELRPTVLPVEKSAWCEALREDTAAQALIMRSPSVNGSMNNKGVSSLGVGVSLSSYMKADLLEETAAVKCRRYLAEAGLQKLVFVSPQGLTVAGYRAKEKVIRDNQRAIGSMRRAVDGLMRNGVITREQATQIHVMADTLLAEASTAKSQADRRLEALSKKPEGARVLAGELLRAESELEDINSRIRSYDAMDVSLSADWNDDINKNGPEFDGDSFSGKVNFSVKLGAVDPRRFEHERRAKEARLRAIRQEEGGTLWQVGVLRRAHERAITGLEDSRVEIDSAITRAQRLENELRAISNPEFKATLIATRMKLIQLKAEKAAISGSISEINDNMKKLK